MYNAIIVDDEPRTVWALQENIEWKKCGIRKVYTANNIRSAFDQIQENKIEILICDIEMPNGDGTVLLEKLNDANINMCCIFVTCHQEYNVMRRAIQLKCYDYVLKPINTETFTQLLIEMVHKMEGWEVQAKDKGKVQWGGFLESDIVIRDSKNVRNIEMEIKSYIKEHLADNIKCSDISDELHFNSNYLMRVFKKETGMSILEYVILARVEAAKKILKGTRLPIKDVAELVGYQDSVYFTKIFHKETGLTPSEYRKKVKG